MIDEDDHAVVSEDEVSKGVSSFGLMGQASLGFVELDHFSSPCLLSRRLLSCILK
jgi:hypothetical protein